MAEVVRVVASAVVVVVVVMGRWVMERGVVSRDVV